MTVNRNRHLSHPEMPSDWPYRDLSEFVSVGSLTWHVQRHKGPNDLSPTLVLLHGTGASTHTWSELIPAFTSFAAVVNPDLPGHGFTEGANLASLTLPAMARDLHALVLELKLKGDIVVIGHSAGAPLAIEWALNYGENSRLPFRITHIVGLNPSLVPPPALYTTLLGPMVAPIATSSPMTHFLSALSAKTGLVNQLLDSTQSQVPETHRRHYQFLFSRASHVRGAMGFMAGADLPSLLARGHTLRMPSTFLLGAQDSWVREEPLRAVIAKSFPSSRVITWQGGHLLHEEQPRHVAQLIQTIVSPPSAGEARR